MSRTIESIWKQGFVNEAQLAVPKINDLYNRKAENIVDKLQGMFTVNVNAILFGGLVLLVLMSLVGMPFLGVYLCVLVAPIYIIAKRELNNSVELSKGQNSYDYLISFDQWLKHSIHTYSGYYKIFYPMLFIGMGIQWIVSKSGAEVITSLQQRFPSDWLLLGQPYYIVMALGLIALIGYLSAGAIYRWDLNLIYARQFKKLEELIKDMETLRR